MSTKVIFSDQMKIINLSDNERPLTTTLDTVLQNFGNLSVDTAVRSVAKKSETKLTVQLDKSTEEMERSNLRPLRVPLRYFPYKVPHRFLFVLKRQRLRNSQNAPAAESTLSYADSLSNVRLVGCDFGGQSLALNTKVFTCERQQTEQTNDRLNLPKSPDSSTFSSYRNTVPLRLRPCWLQHSQLFDQWSSKPTGETFSGDNKRSEGEQSQRQTWDLGLAELTDYFQHFVCLCSPRMSDQAQSMYA